MHDRCAVPRNDGSKGEAPTFLLLLSYLRYSYTYFCRHLSRYPPYPVERDRTLQKPRLWYKGTSTSDCM